MKEKPFTAEERLLKWTDFAVRHGVLEELHVEGSRLNFVVYFNLDVIAAVVFVFPIGVYVFLKFCRSLCSRGRDTKFKRH